MRLLFVVMIFVFSVQAKAQNGFPLGYLDYTQRHSFANNDFLKDSSVQGKKWFVSKYIGLSTSFAFFNGGNATVLSVPIGLQLNRTLNNNWLAFAGVSVAPAYVNFNRSFISANNSKFGQPSSFFSPNQLNMYSRAELGLMYTNDAKTFSISGSIGVERSNYLNSPQYSQPAARTNNFVAPTKRGL